MNPWDDPERIERLKLNGEKREAKDVDTVDKPIEQIPLFQAAYYDVSPKDDLHTMEHPFFAVSKRPDKKVRTFTDSRGRKTTIVPSHTGLATIYDKDILMFVVSHLMHAKNKGVPISENVRIVSHDVLEFSKRGNGGDQYRKLTQALHRLRGTSITTEIETNGKLQAKSFGWILTWDIIAGNDRRVLEFSVRLPEWVFNLILGDEVLTIDGDYFGLSPLQRRLYEVARKHLGAKTKWSIGLTKLKAKIESEESELREFRRNLKRIQKMGLLGYEFDIKGRGKAETVEFTKRGRKTESAPLDA